MQKDLPLMDVTDEEKEGQPRAVKVLRQHNFDIDHDSVVHKDNPTQEERHKQRAYYLANVTMIDTKVGEILVHTPEGDRTVAMPGEPGHQELCDAEQAYMLKAIAEDIDLTRHMTDAVQSLAICLAADESIRTGQPVSLEEISK